MSKRKRARQAEVIEQPLEPAQTVDRATWEAEEFRSSALRDMIFVALPAIVMAIIGQHTIAAAWFSVGMLVLIWQYWHELGSFLRTFRSAPPPPDQPEREEQG